MRLVIETAAVSIADYADVVGVSLPRERCTIDMESSTVTTCSPLSMPRPDGR